MVEFMQVKFIITRLYVVYSMNMKKTLIISACLLVSMIGYAAADELQSAYEYAYGIGITTKPNIGEADMQ